MATASYANESELLDPRGPARFRHLGDHENREMNNSTKRALGTILETVRAWDQFQRRARAFHHIIEPQMANASGPNLSEVEAETRVWLDTVDLAEAAGELHPSCRFLLRAHAVESVHYRRCLDGLYDFELGDISARIDAIRKREGLDEDEYWPIGQGPEDWEELSEQYSQVLDAKFEETLREYGLVDMANLYRQDRKAYDLRREEGRRLVFEDVSELEQVQTVQKQFETEAEICAEGGAYHAAAAMIGSAFEAALLFTCLEHRDDALKARDRLPNGEQPNGGNPKKWNLTDLVLVADEAGWLPNFEVEDGTVITRPLLDMTRNLRNLVHPVRHLSDKKISDVAHTYANARAAYVLLKQHLAESRIENR